MYINIIHRPEPDPFRRSIFKMQQEMAHGLGIRTTILATAPSLFDEETIKLMKMYHADFGNELGLSFHTLDSPDIVEIVGYKDAAIWMYTEEDKRKVIRHLVAKFESVFGFKPTSIGSYHLDASAMRILLEECPTVKITIAGCFEEGVRVYHGCNHSWYLFNEGMPWAAWYPSKTHTLRPAKNEEDAFGVVAVPHLTRDMVLAYEGRNDFWASHPPNVQRGMGNMGGNCPYDKNLIDQHRFQERFNNGYSYLNVFVGAQWLIHNHNSEEDPEVSVSLYRQQLEYIKELVDKGEASCLTMTEFGEWYKKNVPVTHNEISLAKEILYGSGKHYLWYMDGNLRVLFDLFQGGSIGDLRPYISEIPVSTGPDTPHGVYGSYPYLIQSQHRTGYLNHFSDGSRTTLLMNHNGIDVDLADVELKCEEITEGNKSFTTKTVEIRFGESVCVKMKSSWDLSQPGRIIIERELISIEGSGIQELEISEYFKGCYGITDYPEDMKGIILAIDNEPETSFSFSYRRRKLVKQSANTVQASIPQINTIVGLSPCDHSSWKGTIEEGILFNPYYTLKLTRQIKPSNKARICLYLKTMK